MDIVSTIRAWVEAVIGTYTPITYQMETAMELADGSINYTINEVIPNGLSGVDWQFVATAALLLVVIYSVFRLLGVLLQALSGGRRV